MTLILDYLETFHRQYYNVGKNTHTHTHTSLIDYTIRFFPDRSIVRFRFRWILLYASICSLYSDDILLKS